MNVATWLLLLALSILWGGSFFFFKILVAELPPLTIVMGRVVIASLALLACLRFSERTLSNDGRSWGRFFVMAVLNNVVPFTLIVWAETRITSGLASILNATTPVFSVLLAHFFTGTERLTPNRLAGAIVGLLGVGILIGPNALRGLNFTSLAQLGVVLAALLYACAAIYARRFHARLSPLAISAGQLTASAVIMLPTAVALDRPWTFAHVPSLAAWCALLALSLLSTALAYIMYFRVLATAGATNALLVTFLAPLSALLLAALVLKEQLTPLELAGMCTIFAGLALLDGRILRFRGGRRRQSKRARGSTPPEATRFRSS